MHALSCKTKDDQELVVIILRPFLPVVPPYLLYISQEYMLWKVGEGGMIPVLLLLQNTPLR